VVFQQPNRAESLFLVHFFCRFQRYLGMILVVCVWSFQDRYLISSTSLMTWSQQESTGRVVLGVAGQAPLRIGTNRWYPGYLPIASNSHYSWMFRPPITWQFHR
jgi:hypothetical protein